MFFEESQLRYLFGLLLIGLYLFISPAWAEVNHLVGVQLVPLSDSRLRVDFCFDDILKAKPTSFITKAPPRIVIDFLHAKTVLPAEEKTKVVSIDALERYRIVAAQDRIRVLLDLGSYTTYEEAISGKVYRVTIAAPGHELFTQPAKIFVTHRAINAQYKLLSIGFKGIEKQGGRAVFDISHVMTPVEVHQNGRNIQVSFLSTQIPEHLLKQYDVNDFHTPVQRMITRQKGPDAQITLKNTGEFSYFAYQIDKQFLIDVFPLSAEESAQLKLNKQVFLGKRISLNFQDIPVRSILQLLGEFTKNNIVISDAVAGSMTLRLDDVPWDQALNVILTARSLGKRMDGNVMIIAPVAEIAAHEKQEALTAQAIKDSEPVHSIFLEINYAKAIDLATLIKEKNNSLLSKRGTVTVDERTNSLWIQDNDAQLGEIRDFIKKLDIPVKQVLIESRIVDVSKNVVQDLGISFGFTHPNHVSGTLEGANTMLNNIVGPSTSALTPTAGAAAVTPLTDRLNVDLPAQPVAGQAASIGIALAQLGGNILLDLELSALENEGKAELIASPRIITANQQEATIEEGQEIPYQQSTSSGATAVAFKKAVLSLKVTPQITPDGRVLMRLKINQDTPSGQLFNGVPAINTKEIETNVLVKNGQTIVLGGIYQRNKSNNIVRVPFFGTLPYVGALFRQTTTNDTNEELLIFITPKILTDTLSINAVDGSTGGVKEVYK